MYSINIPFLSLLFLTMSTFPLESWVHFNCWSNVDHQDSPIFFHAILPLKRWRVLREKSWTRSIKITSVSIVLSLRWLSLLMALTPPTCSLIAYPASPLLPALPALCTWPGVLGCGSGWWWLSVWRTWSSSCRGSLWCSSGWWRPPRSGCWSTFPPAAGTEAPWGTPITTDTHCIHI